MASLARVAFIAIFMVLLSSVAMAADHIVGDEKGWTLGVDYNNWAQGKVFQVGDNLVFNYNNTKHNVEKLKEKALFDNCTFPSPNDALTSGKDVIELKAEGMKWYACGKDNHCAQQMKLAINVVAAPAAPAPAPSSAHSLSALSSLSMLLLSAVAAIFA